ncbi:MAG: hypothetical protein QNJ17_05705 [Desulfocapsaceae bacterium]|nr:hypothetical protein [Desulfocapsaceae bacterium]
MARDELPADDTVIFRATAAAFATMELSDYTEHFIIEPLRNSWGS